IYSWEHFSSAAQPEYHRSKDLQTSLQDHINTMNSAARYHETLRSVLEACIHAAEPHLPPITLENEVDHEPTPPWEWVYTNHMWYAEDVPPPSLDNITSCGCIGKCDPKNKNCKCVKRQEKWTKEYCSDFAYDKQGKLKQPLIPIFECNDRCRCDDDCRNRAIQAGRKVSVKLKKTREKGWGVFAVKKILKGSFIGVYAGELMRDEEGEKRGRFYNEFGRTYLFDLDFHHLGETKYVVDAFHAGNFTRFLNHSCDPNCHLNACYINDDDLEKPLLTLFAQRDIEAGQELCFAYDGGPDDDGDSQPSSPSKKAPANLTDAVYGRCRCGAPKCRGRRQSLRPIRDTHHLTGTIFS
ncbi:hypothetical protein C8J56DRAFT_766952, partial [Mycena floridula]